MLPVGAKVQAKLLVLLPPTLLTGPLTVSALARALDRAESRLVTVTPSRVTTGAATVAVRVLPTSRSLISIVPDTALKAWAEALAASSTLITADGV